MKFTLLRPGLPLERSGTERVLELMQQLYEQDGLGYDEGRAREAIDGLMDNPPYGGIWLIEADGKTVGYLIVTIGYSLEFHGRYGLLDEFFVDRAWRSRGIGSLALDFAADWCRSQGLKALRLEVGHENLRALGLYRRSGFEVHDRHLMTRWL
ncbi:MAG TPA: GNAT family N-acetyltransferase [Bryobacteraceae bacterium]